MKFIDRYSKVFQFLLPTPLSIAFLLSLITLLFAYFFTESTNSNENYLFTLLEYWEEGLWNKSLMVFAMQMMLMLVLGHILALTPIIDKLIVGICKYATSNSKAALLVTFTTLLVSFFNWGLGLIFGAIICKKIGEQAIQFNYKLNYPLIGAAGYSGLMFWHGGISGSSLIKVAENGHIKNMMQGIMDESQILQFPGSISFNDTVFSSMNIYSSILIIICLPLLMYLLGKRKIYSQLPQIEDSIIQKENSISNHYGAEKFDHSKVVPKIIGLIILIYISFKVSQTPNILSLGFITPNFINLSLIGLGIFFHKNILQFLKALDKATLEEQQEF